MNNPYGGQVIEGYHLHIPSENFGGMPTPIEIMFSDRKDALLLALSIGRNGGLRPEVIPKKYDLSEEEPIQQQLYKTFNLNIYSVQPKGSMGIPNIVIAEEKKSNTTNNRHMQYNLIKKVSVCLYTSFDNYREMNKGVPIVDKEYIQSKIEELSKKKSLTGSQQIFIDDLKVLLEHSYFMN